jgi:two-component sensor histidine kinase
MNNNYFKKAVLILLCFVSFFDSLRAQNALIDSLENLLSTITDERKKADVLNNLSINYKAKNDSLALMYANQAIEIAKKNNFKPELAEGYRAIGNVHYYAGQFKMALPFFEKSKDLFSAEKDDRKTSALLTDIGLMHVYSGELEEGLPYFIESLEMDEFRKDTAGVTASYTNIAMVLQKQGKLEESLVYLKKTIRLDSLTKQWNYYAEDLGNVAMAYKNLKQYDQSLIYALRGYRFADSIQAEVASYQLSGAIGDIYQTMGNFESAEEYLQKSLKTALKTGKSVYISAAYGRLQLNYFHKKDYDLSRLHFDSAIHYSSPISRPELYNNAGQLYDSELADFATAKQLYEKAISNARTIDVPALEVDPLLNLGFMAQKQENYLLAKNYLDQALNINREKPFEIEELKKIGEIYIKSGESGKGLSFMVQALGIQDSLLQKQQNLQQKLLAFEKEVLELKVDNKTKEVEAKNFWLKAAFVGLLALALLVFYAYRNAKIALLQKEKIDELSNELHHRVKNNLANISSMVFLKERKIKDAEARAVLGSIRDRILVLEKIHTRLYEKEYGLKTELKDYLQLLIQELIALNQLDEKEVKAIVAIKGNEYSIESGKAIHIGLLTNEIITNAFKHSLHNNSQPRIEIEAVIEKNILNLSIFNNGKPLPTDFDIDQLDSFGLKWVKGICEQMNWTLHHENIKDGVIFSFVIDLKN